MYLNTIIDFNFHTFDSGEQEKKKRSILDRKKKGKKVFLPPNGEMYINIPERRMRNVSHF